MPKVQLTPAQIAYANSVFAKGGFVPRRKGQRYPKDFMGSDFYGQDGSLNEKFAMPNAQRIARTEFLGTFMGYGHYGNTQRYRAFAIVLPDGSRFAGYSQDVDQYVLCQHDGYVAK